MIIKKCLEPFQKFLVGGWSIHKSLLGACIYTNFALCLDNLKTKSKDYFITASRFHLDYFSSTSLQDSKDDFETSLSLLHNYHKSNSELLQVPRLIQDFFKTMQRLLQKDLIQ